MKTEQPVLITSLKAGSFIPKNFFVGFDGGFCGPGSKALGVSNADTDVSQQLPVTVSGIALVYTNDAISVGSKVESDSEGKAIPLSAGELNGYALDSATEGDQLIRILLV